MIFKLILHNAFAFSKKSLPCNATEPSDDKSTLVYVMDWCGQATNHCLSKCWPRFVSPYGVPRKGESYFNLTCITFWSIPSAGQGSQHYLFKSTYGVHWVVKQLQQRWALTHLPLDKMATISQTTFSEAFWWMKIFVFWSKFHWRLFLRFQLTITRRFFR